MPLFLTVLLIEILGGVEIDLFIPSFPELQRVFHLSPFLVQFMLSANLVAYCICSLFAGALGDRYNRRYVILISLLVLLGGSALCVFANNYPILLIGRVLQGIGMAGPVVLSFPIISDHYPVEKQASLLGLLNGVCTLAMAFAPVIGSYVSFYFGWRANFGALFALSFLCLVMSYFLVPSHPGKPTVSLSPKTYLPLLRSPAFMTFLVAIIFLVTPYWVFIGMAPILYMQDLGVSLKEFGYYQGAIAGMFSIICLLSPLILARCRQKICLYVGMIICMLSALLILALLIPHQVSALTITLVVMVLAGGMVFPINIVFPLSLTVLEGSKGRAAAIMMTVRLLLTAITLGVVSYFYTGTFLTIGLSMSIFILLSMPFIIKLLSNKWMQLT